MHLSLNIAIKPTGYVLFTGVDNSKVSTKNVRPRMANLNVSTIKHNLKRDQEADNPCLKEYHLSLQCLSDNNYVHEACEAYFENYTSCQLFWKRVVADRSRKNIVPYLPSSQDRAKVKNEYLKSPISEVNKSE